MKEVEQSELRVVLPNGSSVTVDVQVHVRSSEVCNILGAKIGLREGSMGAFALFRAEESGFCEFVFHSVCECECRCIAQGRVCVLPAVCKLSPSDFPCKVAEGGQTLLLRKWVFSTQQVSLPPAIVTHPQAQTVSVQPTSLIPPPTGGEPVWRSSSRGLAL